MTRWIDLPHVADDRGTLTWMETGAQVPFDIRRVFFLRDVRAARGDHAHRTSTQLLVAVAGAFTVDTIDGTCSSTHFLADPRRGVLVPPLTWVHLRDFTPDAVCLVLADEPYSEAGYIRERGEFDRIARAPAAETRIMHPVLSRVPVAR